LGTGQEKQRDRRFAKEQAEGTGDQQPDPDSQLYFWLVKNH
jgi:hypothetical protein